MKIYLFLKSKLLTFTIPQKVSGSFSFDENPEEESKLINIEAQENEWHIYSTADVSVISGDTSINDLVLKTGSYYLLRRNEEDYLIYVTDTFDSTFLPYSYKEDINLIIGNDTTCNINYLCPYISGAAVKVTVKEGKLLLTVVGNIVYVNNLCITPSDKSYVLNSGDELNIYGLKIVFLNGFLLLNNPMNNIKCDYTLSHLLPYKLDQESQPMDIEVKDEELYTKEQYFSKAPRIRRLIKTKEVNLSPPPKQEGEDRMPLILTIGPMLTMGLASAILLINNISKIMIGSSTIQSSWPTLATSAAMLLSMLLWPALTKFFNRKIKRAKKKELIEKYTKYLNEKKEELRVEAKLQEEILVDSCKSMFKYYKCWQN